MAKRITCAAVLIWILFIIQSTVLTKLNIGGIVPNLLIVLTACYGFMCGETFGLLVGFFCGVLMDLFFAPFMGFYAIIFMYLGYLNGKFCNLFYPEDIKLPLALITTTDLLYGLSCYTFLFLLRGRFNFSYFFGHIIFPEVIATIIFSLILYPVLLKLHKLFMVDDR